jgi:hypothetical protein
MASIEVQYSPSGKYKVEIHENEWVLKRCSDDSIIYSEQIKYQEWTIIYDDVQKSGTRRPTIKYGDNFRFFERKGEEWFYSVISSLYKQTFVNLETGEVYQTPPEDTSSDDDSEEEVSDDEESYRAFIEDLYRKSYAWCRIIPNQDGTIFAVLGSTFKTNVPTHIQFYDFSDPSKGWPPMKVLDKTYNNIVPMDLLSLNPRDDYKWIGEVFDYTRLTPEKKFSYHVHFYPENGFMARKLVEEAPQ